MSFTVMRPGGTKDAEFQAYARLLRQTGKDLGKLPRVPEPGTGRRWLYAWAARDEAQAFADELKKRTGKGDWVVVEVASPPSEGPLGPLMIQMVRQTVGLTFGLHPLSQALIQSAFPGAVASATDTTIDIPTWNDFKKRKGGLADLVREIAPLLTGLNREQLNTLGYSVVDDDTDETLVSVPPSRANQG
jgi:hypothetical protein